MTVSVIIPTYRRSDLLRRALSSIGQQTTLPQEVVVVNDGGPDMELPEDFPFPLRTIQCPNNRGAAQARNEGAGVCQGRWIAFLDDDDTWAPGYLEAVVRELEQGAQLTLAGFWKVKPHQAPSPEKIPPLTLKASDWLVKNQGLRGSNLVIERSLFLAMEGFDPTLKSLHDMDFAIRLASIPDLRYHPIRKRLVYFHVHEGPRLSTPRSPANLAGLAGFWRKYQDRMTTNQRQAFLDRALQIWGVQLQENGSFT